MEIASRACRCIDALSSRTSVRGEGSSENYDAECNVFSNPFVKRRRHRHPYLWNQLLNHCTPEVFLIGNSTNEARAASLYTCQVGVPSAG